MKPTFLEFAEPVYDWPLASECEELVVGKTYLVPCINGIAVIGDPHTDNDHFNYTEHHYHCDSRFHEEFSFGGPANCAMRARRCPTLEPRTCIRTTPAPFTDGVLATTRMALYADYGFAESKCGRCPHKGMPIINGVCSGHRLEWLADGTIKYKPPYTLQIRGTDNKLVIDARTELEGVEIPVTEAFTGVVHLDMLDRDGSLIGTRDCGYLRFAKDDTFKIIGPTPVAADYELPAGFSYNHD